jgi:hypothetical protein
MTNFHPLDVRPVPHPAVPRNNPACRKSSDRSSIRPPARGAPTRGCGRRSPSHDAALDL